MAIPEWHDRPVAARESDPGTWRDFAVAFGTRLRQLRFEHGLSQAEVARRTGIAAQTYQNYEKGESGRGAPINCELFTLCRLCETFGVDLVDLLPPIRPDLSRVLL
jgi:transcriptional regulator with XRE-family HTH domain